ncbi:unnamed protein product [Alopecurus aequalis]
MAAPPDRRASPPVLPDELVEEILLRLPPDDPACLLRAYAVCKTWGCAVFHPSFRRRIHELHRTPPVLGFLHDCCDERTPNFFPMTASAFSLAATPDPQFWRALDHRHGRALFLHEPDSQDAKELLVWEPITGAQHRVPVPVEDGRSSAATVFCAADGCRHHDCLGGPFCLVFVSCVKQDTDNNEEYVTSGAHSLTVFDTPDTEYSHGESLYLMLAEDGGLGLTQVLDSHLKLWSWKRIDLAGWVLSRVIDLGNLLPTGSLGNASASLLVLGFAEGANVIFLDTAVGLFTIEVPSERVRKVCGSNFFCQAIPVVGFYTPVSRLMFSKEDCTNQET